MPALDFNWPDFEESAVPVVWTIYLIITGVFLLRMLLQLISIIRLRKIAEPQWLDS